MKTLELPEEIFSKLETYRRSRKLSRAEAIQLIEETWWRNIASRPDDAPQLTEEEADKLAVEVVREYRRSRRNRRV